VPQRGAIQLAQVRDELVVWMKTLVSAAIYATLIVTFIAQVARVEGQSMAPTLGRSGSAHREQARLPAWPIRAAATS
jgi:hypothetical protein